MLLPFTRSGIALAAAALSLSAMATPITFTGTGTTGGPTGDTLSASASFDVIGSHLVITLLNTAPDDTTGQMAPNQGLTGLFFDLPDSIALSPVSALITSGQIIQGNACDVSPPGNDNDNAANCTAAQHNVGGEFAYATGGLPSGADRGIASSGYANFGASAAFFAGSNLDGPVSPSGINFALISQNETAFDPNGGLAKVPLIQGAVTFTLNISGGTISNGDISHVLFQYGTGLDEPRLTGTPVLPQPQPTPEPGSLALLGIAGLALRFATRRRG
jgi:hypothetical protein